MSKFTVNRGVSGSGKSTWAAAQPNAIVVSRDALRVAFYGSDGPDYYQHPDLRAREDHITKVETAAIEAGLVAGKHVISDNTNIETKYMKPYIKLAQSLGAEVEVKVHDVDLDTALRRNAMRGAMGGRMVPEDIIRKQYKRFQETKKYKVPEVLPLPEPYSGTPGKPLAFMVDIDGTLAHMDKSPGGRGSYREGAFAWHRVGEDLPDEVVVDVVRNLADDHTPYNVIVMSGRDESCREQTEEWLTPYVPFNHLFMRPEGDNRPDNIIKAELFDRYVRDNFDVKFVIDDRWQVCRMWLTMGLKVFNVSGLDRGEF
jgi:predicted kinase